MIKNNRLIIGNNAYAVIETDNGSSLDVLLSPGMSPSKYMENSVKELREQADKLIARAYLISAALPRFA